MNERIKALYKQATGKKSANDFDARVLEAERFAELIVRECIARVEGCAVGFDDNYPNDQFIAGYNKGVSKTASQVKQHFGVEE